MVAGVVSGSYLSGRLAHRWPARRTVNVSLSLMVVASLLNLAQAHWLAPAPWNVVGPLVLYAFGIALAMPQVTVMALDCFPRNRGMASSVQGFLQMSSNALVAALAVPLVDASVRHFAAVQALFLLIALLLWFSVGIGVRHTGTEGTE